MVTMFVVGGVLAVAFAVVGVLAAFADRRRSIEVDGDGSRFAPAVLDPKLPWA
ncbi:MAG: hypothetical protein JWQ74_2723 [Marmoricola sp.]|nr:hypothetical protein [Marmoricola sp.]